MNLLQRLISHDAFRIERPIAVVLAVIVAAHVSSFLYFSNLAAGRPGAMYPVLAGDSGTYVALAESLIEKGGFVGSGFETERHWPPGYPVFLAAVKLATGSFAVAVVVQVALALVAVVLIYTMALRFLPPLWAAAPALLYGIDPNVVLANTVILSDSVFSSLIILAVYGAFFWEPERHIHILKYVYMSNAEVVRWGMVGILLGVATLVRPIAQFLVVLAPLALGLSLYVVHSARDVRSYLAPLTVYAVAAFLVIAPWLTFVHERFGVYEVSHVGASNLLWYNAQDFLAWKEMNEERCVPAIVSTRYRDDPAYERVRVLLTNELAQLAPEGADPLAYEGALAARYILADPIRYAYFHVVNTAPFFLASSIAAYQQVVVQVRDGTGYFAPTLLAVIESARALVRGEYGSALKTLPVALEVLFWVLVCVLALIGLWKGRRDVAIIAFAALVAYFALLTGPVSIARYRIPAEPYLLTLAALGAYVVYQRIRHVAILRS